MPDSANPDRAPLDAALRAVLGNVAGALSATEAALLAELEGLGRTVARAKADVARLRVADIADRHIPTATDELDAIVAHTAQATNDILDCCEALEAVATRVGGADAAELNAALTRIYEACGFQDITGQRSARWSTRSRPSRRASPPLRATSAKPSRRRRRRKANGSQRVRNALAWVSRRLI
jgi:chemotaxis protein CheZ